MLIPMKTESISFRRNRGVKPGNDEIHMNTKAVEFVTMLKREGVA